MNAFIYDLRAVKYRFIQAYFYSQLKEAEKLTQNGKGRECTSNTDVVSKSIDKIMKIIEDNNNTYENILAIANANPAMSGYYNVIGKVVAKHFKLDAGWIPSFLAIEVFRLFQEKGYSDFNDINFIELQEYYQRHKNRKDSNLPLHYKCAEDVYKSLMIKKVFKKNRSRRK